MLARLSRLWQPGRVRTIPALADWIAGRAAFVSQKSTIDFCRARVGLGWDRFMGEPTFAAAMDCCRWEAYAMVLTDATELVQILLRRRGQEAVAMPGHLLPVVGSALLRHPPPPHRGSWTTVLAEMKARLAWTLAEAPRPVHVVGGGSAAAIFEVLPIRTIFNRSTARW